MKKFHAFILILLLIVVAGCSSNNSNSPTIGGGSGDTASQQHPTTWVADHGAQATVDLRGCQGCHGFDFKGAGQAVSCFKCHSSGPPFAGAHPVSWNANPLQGHQDNFKGNLSDQTPWTTCAVAACHGNKLEGGSGPTCQNAAACHTPASGSTTGWPPAPSGHIGFSPPSNGNHGLAAKGVTDPTQSMGNYCIMCHATPTNALATRFNGGFVSDLAILGVANGNCSATACHFNGTTEKATAHPSNWASSNPSSTVVHNDGNITTNPNIKSDSCALCHTTTGQLPVSPFTNAPTCFDDTYGGLPAGSCHATGPGAPHDSLNGTSIDYTAPGLHGPAAKADLAYCAGCHATSTTAGSNPRFNKSIGDLQGRTGLPAGVDHTKSGCEKCHSVSGPYAGTVGVGHPVGTDRWTFHQDASYPTRRTHFAAGLDGTNPRDLSGCSLCHNVTTADSVGAAPACTTCHLNPTASFNVGVKCTYCHLTPPDGNADLAGKALYVTHTINGNDVSTQPLHKVCSLCHGASQNGTTGELTASNPAKYLLTNYTSATSTTDATYQGGDHLDGNIEMNGDSLSTAVGAGYNEGTWNCTNTCHSAAETNRALSDSGLPVEYGDYGSGACNSCHAYPPDGNAWPDGSQASSTNHTAFGRSGTANSTDLEFYAAHDVCSACHGVKGNQTPPALATARTGEVNLLGSGGDRYLASYHNQTPNKVQMNGFDAAVAGALTPPDTTDDNNAGYDGAGGCTNACHPAATGYKLTPSGLNTVEKREFGGGCNSCHGYPPTTGAHLKHAGGSANIVYDCQMCHTSPFDPATHNQSGMTPGGTVSLNQSLVNLKTSLGGLSNIPAGGSFASGSCSLTYCHGSGTPVWSPPSIVQCGDCHGDVNGRPATPASGGNHFTAGHSTSANNCDFCHPHNGSFTSNPDHVNGSTSTLYSAQVSSTGTVNNKLGAFTPGTTTLGTEPSTLLKYSNSTCSNNAAGCHNIAGTWGGGGACDGCHSVPASGAPQVTTASTHVDADGAGTANTAGTCTDCHAGHVGAGGVIIALPPDPWGAPIAGETHVTGNMRTALGINYLIHGGIQLGGPGTVASINGQNTEAEICWGCHDSLATKVSEWGYNTDPDGTTWPATKLADRDGATANSYNYGTLHSTKPTDAVTNVISNWVQPGAWYRNGHLASLDRPIASAHAVSFTASDHVSSVGFNVTGGRVRRGSTATNNALPGAASGQGSATAVQIETVAALRCAYCHDVHDTHGPNGKPYVRGTWMNNPYPSDSPPQSGTIYATNQQVFSRAQNGTPRPTIISKIKGGYWLDQNSANISGSVHTAPTITWNTSVTPAYTTTTDVATTAGLCIICHGGTGTTGASTSAEINNMDYYNGTGNSIWRTANGHNYAALGGTKGALASDDDLFDATRGAASSSGRYMGNQGRVGSYSSQPSWVVDSTSSPLIRTGSGSSVYNSGWWSRGKGSQATTNVKTASYDYNTWYAANSVPPKFHYFTCSKCHSPHATGLPALLITNCVDKTMATWSATTFGDNANPSVSQSSNCHRKESSTTGWNSLQPAQ